MAAKTSFLLSDGDNANAAAAVNLLADQGRISNFHLIRDEINASSQHEHYSHSGMQLQMRLLMQILRFM